MVSGLLALDDPGASFGSYHCCTHVWGQRCAPTMHGVSLLPFAPVKLIQVPHRLLRRIEGKSRTQREPLNELQPDIPAMEVLNDVGKLIREVSKYPLYSCQETYSTT